jgi:hypothetical protein
VWSIAMMTITRPRMMSSEARRPAAGPLPAIAVAAGEETVEDVIASPLKLEVYTATQQVFVFNRCWG